jgi:hypothetical protein
VCLCEFEELEELVCLACGHLFHSACAEPWLCETAVCPVCRAEVQPGQQEQQGQQGQQGQLHQLQEQQHQLQGQRYYRRRPLRRERGSRLLLFVGLGGSSSGSGSGRG